MGGESNVFTCTSPVSLLMQAKAALALSDLNKQNLGDDE